MTSRFFESMADSDMFEGGRKGTWVGRKADCVLKSRDNCRGDGIQGAIKGAISSLLHDACARVGSWEWLQSYMQYFAWMRDQPLITNGNYVEVLLSCSASVYNSRPCEVCLAPLLDVFNRGWRWSYIGWLLILLGKIVILIVFLTDVF